VFDHDNQRKAAEETINTNQEARKAKKEEEEKAIPGFSSKGFN